VGRSFNCAPRGPLACRRALLSISLVNIPLVPTCARSHIGKAVTGSFNDLTFAWCPRLFEQRLDVIGLPESQLRVRGNRYVAEPLSFRSGVSTRGLRRLLVAFFFLSCKSNSRRTLFHYRSSLRLAHCGLSVLMGVCMILLMIPTRKCFDRQLLFRRERPPGGPARTPGRSPPGESFPGGPARRRS